MKIVIFLLLQTSLSFPLLALDKPELDPFVWLVKIESAYQDLSMSSPQFKTTVGTGTLVRVEDKYFVLTNTHLTKGKGLKLTFPSANLDLKPMAQQKIGIHEFDVELLQIENPHLPDDYLFVWETNNNLFSHTVNKKYLSKIINYSISENHFIHDTLLIPLKSNQKHERLINNYMVPKPSWAKPLSQSFSNSVLDNNNKSADLSIQNDQNLWLDASSSILVIDGEITPGMSGSPLLLFQKETSKLYLGGVTRSFHRHFPLSYFTAENVIKILVKAYTKGFRGSGESFSAEWHFNSKIGLYRTMNDISEISPDIIPAGGGDTSDGGGSDTSDGGNSERTAVITQTHDLKPLSYSNLGIRPGIMIKNTNILGLSFELSTNPKQKTFNDQKDIIIYADYGSIFFKQLMTDTFSDLKIKYITPSDSLFQLFKVKAANALQKRTLSQSELDHAPCLIDRDALPLNKIRMRLLRPVTQGLEKTYLELNSDGVLNGSNNKKFEPYVLVGKEKPFIIDLKGLFFMVTTDTRIPLESYESINEEMAKEDALESFYNSLPYVYYQRTPETPAYPAFCKVISNSLIFKN